jgi:hypothetical protein
MEMNSSLDRETRPSPSVASEMGKMPVEPLLPIEKKLIGWSLGLGIVLLVVLVAIAKLVVHTA